MCIYDIDNQITDGEILNFKNKYDYVMKFTKGSNNLLFQDEINMYQYMVKIISDYIHHSDNISLINTLYPNDIVKSYGLDKSKLHNSCDEYQIHNYNYFRYIHLVYP